MNFIYYKTYFQSKLRDRLKPVIKSDDRPYKSIGILDPSIGTANLGDLIISEAVSKEINQLFPTYQKVRYKIKAGATGCSICRRHKFISFKFRCEASMEGPSRP
jgi:hypothetical protein